MRISGAATAAGAVVALAAVAVIAAGCAVDPDPGGPGGPGGSGGSGTSGGALAGRTFLSETVSRDQEPVDLVDGTRIRLEFTTDGRLVANAGCNTLSTDLTTTGGTLATTGVGGTEMGCDRARHEQDDWLARFLEHDPVWELDGDRLTLTGGTTVIVLLDREVADPDRPLERTRWTVDTIIVGDAASSMVAGTEGTAWLVIEEGAFTASTGCRDITGRVVVGEDRLRFLDAVQTDPACPPELADLDEVMRQIVTGEVGFTVQAQRLRLEHPAGVGLGLHADS